MVVDDVYMTIGSANFTFRGTTYEMEINAAAVDRTLQQGGGVAVREQRIEFCRRMLGLPAVVRRDDAGLERLLPHVQGARDRDGADQSRTAHPRPGR